MSITIVTANVDEAVCDGMLHGTVVFMNMAAIIKAALVYKWPNVTEEAFHFRFNDVP